MFSTDNYFKANYSTDFNLVCNDNFYPPEIEEYLGENDTLDMDYQQDCRRIEEEKLRRRAFILNFLRNNPTADQVTSSVEQAPVGKKRRRDQKDVTARLIRNSQESIKNSQEKVNQVARVCLKCGTSETPKWYGTYYRGTEFILCNDCRIKFIQSSQERKALRT